MHDAGHPVKVKFAFRVRTWIGSTQNKKLRQRAKKTDDKNLKDQSTKSKLGQNARRGKRMHSGKLETPMFVVEPVWDLTEYRGLQVAMAWRP